MTRSDHQLDRLLRAAAAASPEESDDSATVPSARWLLRQCGESEPVVPQAMRPVLRGGLALACLLLLVSSLLNARQIAQANQDVFAGPEAALTRLATR